MIFIFTNSKDLTSTYLEDELLREGCDCVRLNTDIDIQDVKVRLRNNECCLCIKGRTVNKNDIESLIFRRPGKVLTDAGRDAAERAHSSGEWEEALEGFFAQVPIHRWVNHPYRNVRASHKIEQLLRAKRYSLLVPLTLVTQSESEFFEFYNMCGRNIIVKPLKSGYLEREDGGLDSVIYTNKVCSRHLAQIKELNNCPTLFQENIKKIFDVRIILIDNFVVACRLSSVERTGNEAIDIRRNNMLDVSYCQIDIPTSVRISLQRLMKSYGLRFAAVDMAIDAKENWYFLEINPNGQWAWLDVAGATRIAHSFIAALTRKCVDV